MNELKMRSRCIIKIKYLEINGRSYIYWRYYKTGQNSVLNKTPLPASCTALPHQTPAPVQWWRCELLCSDLCGLRTEQSLFHTDNYRLRGCSECQRSAENQIFIAAVTLSLRYNCIPINCSLGTMSFLPFYIIFRPLHCNELLLSVLTWVLSYLLPLFPLSE